MKLKKHPIYKAIFDRFKGQAKKGVSKYGALVQSENLTHQEWLEHAAEELTDLLVYIQCAKEADGDTVSKAIVKLKEKSDRIIELENAINQVLRSKDLPQLYKSVLREALGYDKED